MRILLLSSVFLVCCSNVDKKRDLLNKIDVEKNTIELLKQNKQQARDLGYDVKSDELTKHQYTLDSLTIEYKSKYE